MKHQKLLILLTALFLACASVAWAVQAKSSSQAPAKETKAAKGETKAEAKLHQATGEITAMSETSLTLSHLRGKKMETTFSLASDTKKDAGLKVGDRVVVHYRAEGEKKVAVRVKAAAAKAKAEGKAKAAKPKG